MKRCGRCDSRVRSSSRLYISNVLMLHHRHGLPEYLFVLTVRVVGASLTTSNFSLSAIPRRDISGMVSSRYTLPRKSK
jgi:hypothetical protein